MEAKQFDELKKILGDLPKKLGDVLAKSSAAVRGPAGEGMAARGAGGVRTSPTDQPVPGDLIPNPFLEGASKFSPAGPVRDIATLLSPLFAKTVPEPAPVLQQGPIGLMGLEPGQGKPKLPMPLQPLEHEDIPALMSGGEIRRTPAPSRRPGPHDIPHVPITGAEDFLKPILPEWDIDLMPSEGHAKSLPPVRPLETQDSSESRKGDIGLMPAPLVEPKSVPRPAPMLPTTAGYRSPLGVEKFDEPRGPTEGLLGAKQIGMMSMAGGGPEGLQGGAGTETLTQALKELKESTDKLNGHMERAERDQGKGHPQAPVSPIGMTAVPTTAPPSPSAQQRTRRGATSAAETTATILSAIARARGS